MKSLLLSFLLLLALSTPLFAKSLGDQINAIQKDLNNKIALRTVYKQKAAALVKKKDNIKFAYDAFEKQSAIHQQSITEYEMEVTRHNNNQCAKKCVNGSCDGSCTCYNAEKNRLDHKRAQIETKASLLDQIRDNMSRDTADWTAQTDRLIAEFAHNKAAIVRLQDQLAKLRRQYDICRGSIPVECDRPDAVRADGKPLLNGQCKHMHAVYGQIFDDNR